MFQRPNYKLVCTATWARGAMSFAVGDTVTTAPAPQHYGGEHGWIQDDGCAEWQLNTPSLDEAKTTQRALINSSRDAAEAATPFVYDGSPFDYDALSRERINAATSGSIIAAMGGMSVTTVVATWTLADNTSRDMKISDWLAFKQAEIARSSGYFSKATSLKAQIDAASTADDVLKVNW